MKVVPFVLLRIRTFEALLSTGFQVSLMDVGESGVATSPDGGLRT